MSQPTNPIPDLEETGEIFKNSLGDYFQESAFHYGSGTLYALHGQMKEAADQFRKGLESNNRSPFLRMGLAHSLEHLQEYANAEEEYKKLLKIAPNRAEVYLALVRVYNNLQDLPQAEKCLLEFIDRFPGHYQIHVIYNLLAGIYIKQSQTDKALATLLTLEQSFDKSVPAEFRAHIFNNTGILYCQKSLWSKALEKFHQALAARPGYPPAQKNADMVSEQLKEENPPHEKMHADQPV